MKRRKPVCLCSACRDWRGCLRKRAFGTKAEAELFAFECQRKQRPYCCPECGKWHLTTRTVGK